MKSYVETMTKFYSLSDEMQAVANEIALNQFAKKVEDRISGWDILEIVDKGIKQ